LPLHRYTPNRSRSEHHPLVRTARFTAQGAQVSCDYLVRIAFAPDSQRLAISAFDQNTGSGKISVLDTATKKSTALGPIEGAWSLAWSPDGRQLATLLWPSSRRSDELLVQVVVFDLERGTASKVRTQTEPDWGRTSIEIPLEGWVAHFPLTMGGLESCNAPPGDQSASGVPATPEVK
jgi:WD40 repeat protein